MNDTWQKLYEEKEDCLQHWWQPDGKPVPKDGPGSDHPDQCVCAGTGIVPRFPLRKACPGSYDFGGLGLDCVGGHLTRMTTQGMKSFKGKHGLCNGTGWVLDPEKCHLEVILDALDPDFVEITYETQASNYKGFTCRMVFYSATEKSGYLDVKSEIRLTRLEAALEAAVKALEKEKA